MALACSVAPDVMVSFGSAARLWGMRRVGNDGLLHVTIAGRAHRSIPDTVVHRSHRIDLVDVVDRTDGIRVTSPPRTVFDLSAKLSDERIHSIVEQLLHSDACTMTDAVGDRPATAASAAAPDRRASRRVLSRAARRGSSRSAPTSSSASSVPSSRPASPDPNARQRSGYAAGSSSILTSCGGQQGEALEVDHVTFHGGKLDQYYDKWRDRQLRLVGIHVDTSDRPGHRRPARCGRRRRRARSSPHPARIGVVEDANSRQIAEGR